MYIKYPAHVIHPIHVWPLHYIQSRNRRWLTAAPVPMTMSRQVHIIISHLCMEGRKPQHSFSCVLYPFLDTLWCYFLTILLKLIKLHRKDNHQSKALFFSSFWTTWRRSKVSYGSQSSLSVPCILNGSIFIEHQQFSVLKKNTWSVSSILHMTVATPVI